MSNDRNFSKFSNYDRSLKILLDCSVKSHQIDDREQVYMYILSESHQKRRVSSWEPLSIPLAPTGHVHVYSKEYKEN